MAERCTLDELRTVYTIDDLADYHEALDIQDEYQARFDDKAKAESERKRR